MNSYRHSSAAGRPHSSTPTSVQPSVAGLGDEHLCSGCRVSGSFTVGRSRSDRSRQQPEERRPHLENVSDKGCQTGLPEVCGGRTCGAASGLLGQGLSPTWPRFSSSHSTSALSISQGGLTPKISFGEKGLRTQTQKANCSTHAASGLTAQTTARGTWGEWGSVVLPHTHCLQGLEGQQVGCAE